MSAVKDPSIVVRAADPGNWGRRVSLSWPVAGWVVHGDNSEAHGGEETAPDGFGFLGAALGVCMVTTLLACAQREGIRLRGVEAHIATKARLRGVGRAPHLETFHIDLYVDGEVDEIRRAQLEEATTRLCGVRETLRRGAEVSERVHLGRAPRLDDVGGEEPGPERS